MGKKTSTGFPGVDIHKGRYRARIYHRGYMWHLGTYDDPYQAFASVLIDGDLLKSKLDKKKSLQTAKYD